jgi:hypothetical protein
VRAVPQVATTGCRPPEDLREIEIPLDDRRPAGLAEVGLVKIKP